MAHAPLSPDTHNALAALEAVLCGIAIGKEEHECRGHFALAYSGGMDSRFLAHAAKLLGFTPHLFMATGPQLSPEEASFGENWARMRGLPFQTVAVSPLELPLVARNDKERCYECKRELFRCIKAALALGAGERIPLPLCDGTNASDALCYRPGLKAVRELGVLSPLAMAGLTKADIYRLAALTGMERPEQKPRPCLLTRLPYGMKPSRELLQALAAGESAVLRALEGAGLPDADLRLRLVPQAGGERVLELHMLHEDMTQLPPALSKALPALIAEVAPALPAPAHLVPQSSLSGFFDKLQHQA
jgi:uncharacterized protein